MGSTFRLKITLLAVLCSALLAACASNERMMRMTPFWSDQLPDPDRVNVWPLYYQNEDVVVVLWPIFDVDSKGFALRPVISKEEAEWSFLYALAGWNTETGDWWAVPVYDFEDNHGVAPLWNFGEWNHVLLAWWLENSDGDVTDWGVLPFYGRGDLNHIGPVWWTRSRPDEPRSWGVFPLAAFDDDSGWLVNTYWEKKDDELKVLTALPLFYYSRDGSYRRFITPLGGRGWSEDGEKGFYNVLGPVFHYDTDGESSYAAVLWPIFTAEQDEDSTEVELLPVFRYRGSDRGHSLSALAALVEHTEYGDRAGVRVAPLFSHKKGVPMRIFDHLTLYSYWESQPRPRRPDESGDEPGEEPGEEPGAEDGRTPPPNVKWHVGTPLLFNFSRTGGRTRWGSLLNILDYESEGDESEFAFLYYLYRHQRKGEQVRRDFFPFFTWDSGPERSGFSFLWRVFRWERVQDRSRGYFLFIPWGDHSGPTGERPASRPR